MRCGGLITCSASQTRCSHDRPHPPLPHPAPRTCSAVVVVVVDGLHGTDGYDPADFAKPRKKRAASAEWRLQAACIAKLRKAMRRDSNIRFIAAMPENQRDRKRAAMAKMMGLERGVADIIVWRKLPGVPGVYDKTVLRVDWIELKRPGGKATPEQIAWAEWFYNTPVRCHVITSVEEFLQILEGT